MPTRSLSENVFCLNSSALPQKKCSQVSVDSDITYMTLRKLHIQLPPPEYYPDKAPIDVWLVHAVEINPPEGIKAVEWFPF